MGPMAARGAQGQSKVTPHVVGPHGGAGPYLPVANMSVTVTPLATHQPRVWLNDEAPLNISYIVVTLSTLQSLSGWLKDEASTNIWYIRVTLSTRHWLAPRFFCFASVLQSLARFLGCPGRPIIAGEKPHEYAVG